jgi:hypothetical protein
VQDAGVPLPVAEQLQLKPPRAASTLLAVPVVQRFRLGAIETAWPWAPPQAPLALALYVNNVFAVLVPPGVVTSTLAAPAKPDDVVHVTEVDVFALNGVHAFPPTVTALTPVRLVPVMVTLVPPAVVPLVGLIPPTVGVGTACVVISEQVTEDLLPEASSAIRQMV